MRLRIDENNNRRLPMWMLAEAMGISKEHLSKIKSGKAWEAIFTHLEKVARAIGCYPVDLLPRSWQRPPGLPDLGYLEQCITEAMTRDGKEFERLTGKKPNAKDYAKMAYTNYLDHIKEEIGLTPNKEDPK